MGRPRRIQDDEDQEAEESSCEHLAEAKDVLPNGYRICIRCRQPVKVVGRKLVLVAAGKGRKR